MTERMVDIEAHAVKKYRRLSVEDQRLREGKRPSDLTAGAKAKAKAKARVKANGAAVIQRSLQSERAFY